MEIAGIQKLTLLDYPGKVACTIFLNGCDFRCPFCHNWELATNTDSREQLVDFPIIEFLTTRRNVLDGVVISGGEPLLYDLRSTIRIIKDLGFFVKIDTNGNHPDRLKELFNEKLVDYVAMDIKNSPKKYPATIGRENFDLSKVKESIDLLINGEVDYEFRTTVMNELHTTKDMYDIRDFINGAKRYYIQPFVDRDTVPNHDFTAPSKTSLAFWEKVMKKTIPEVGIRGI